MPAQFIRGNLAALFTAAVWALTYAATKSLYAHVSPIDVIVLRFSVALVCLTGIALATHEPLIAKTVSNIREVQTRGANVLCLACDDHRELAEVAQNTIFIPKICDMMLPSLAVVPMQILAYYMARFKGCEIDTPRNLAKSVTVE